MGIVDEMHNLCEDIVTARFERGELLRGIRSDTGELVGAAQKMVKDFGAERVEMAKDLSNDLKASVIETKEAVKAIKVDAQGTLKTFGVERSEMSTEMAKDLKGYTTELKSIVKGLRTDADTLLNDLAKERVTMRGELRKELEEYTSGVKDDVSGLLTDFRAVRKGTVDDLKKMHEEWQKMVKPRAAEKKAPSKEEIGEVDVEETELGELKDKVLEIVQSTRRISLAGIGLKLGVEWRKLIRPAKELIYEGKIKKEDLNYYPV